MKDTKQQENKREYGCPCGKTYLSYPALFTHIKTKHEGKAPGKITKPQTGKVRGRPKTRKNSEEIEFDEILNMVHHNISALLEGKQSDAQRQFVSLHGNRTCQDAANEFLNEFSYLQENGLQVLTYFLSKIKEGVEIEFGVRYWHEENAEEIISASNKVYSTFNEQQSAYGLSKEMFKDLIFNYFQWLYAHKLTDHRLLKNQ